MPGHIGTPFDPRYGWVPTATGASTHTSVSSRPTGAPKFYVRNIAKVNIESASVEPSGGHTIMLYLHGERDTSSTTMTVGAALALAQVLREAADQAMKGGE